LAHLQTIDVRQHQIQNDQINCVLLQVGKTSSAITTMHKAIARLAEVVADHQRQAVVVFYHQNLYCHALPTKGSKIDTAHMMRLDDAHPVPFF